MQESANNNSILKINNEFDLEISFTDETVDHVNNSSVSNNKNLNQKTLKERINDHLIPTNKFDKKSTVVGIKTGFLTLDDFYSNNSITGADIRLNEVENLSVIDIDINHHDEKMEDQEVEQLSNFIIEICKKNDYILGRTPSGGFHIYCNSDDSWFSKLSKTSNSITQIKLMKGLDLDLFTSRDPNKIQNILVIGSRVIYPSNPNEIKQSVFINGSYDSVINYSLTDVLKELNWIEKIEQIFEAKNKSKSNISNTSNVSNNSVSNQKNNYEYEEIELSEDVQKSLINGLFGIEIHNFTHTEKTIEDELTLMPLFQAINNLNENLIDSAYHQVFDYNDLTDNASKNFKRVREENKDIKQDFRSLINIIKTWNKPYYKENILPLIGGVEVKKFDLFNDKFDFLKFKENAEHHKYKTLSFAANELLRVLRYQTKDKYFIEKDFDDDQNIYSISYQSRDIMKKELQDIKLFKKDKNNKKSTSYYSAWDAYNKYSSLFHFNLIKFNDKRSDENFKIISYFHGFKYKKLKEINHELIDDYLRLIREGIANNSQEINEYILKWIANIIQNPGIKNEVGLVLTGSQGTGKTSFTNVLEELTSGYSDTIDGVKELTGEYTTVIENKMLIIANELLSAKSEFLTNMNALKSIITDKSKRGREIYGKFHYMENCCNLIFCSNYNKPIIINNDDRRYCIIKTSDKFKRNFDFFKKLHDNQTEDFFNNLFTYFSSIDLSDFNPRNFPITEARKELISACRSDVEDFIIEYFDRFVNGVVFNDLKTYFSIYYGCYDARKFKKFQTELKEKMINNGEYRPRQFDGSRPKVFKLKQEFIELYKNEIYEEDLEE